MSIAEVQYMSSSRFGTRFRKRRLAAAACAAAVVTAPACSSGGGSSSGSGNAASGSNSSTGTVTVAVVSNPLVTGQMIPLTQSVFAKNSWLVALSKQYLASAPSYDASDLLPAVAKALSYKGDLYSAPFYGESSMLYYNKSLLSAAGVTMPLHPTWAQVQAAAAKVNQPGWGDNMAPLDTVINTFGGDWYNTSWQAQLNSPADTAAINFYVNLIKSYGESGASNDSFNQLLTLYGQGKCAMWYDATVAATSIATTYPSVYAQTGYAFAPVDKTTSSGWLWSWSLGIPQGVSDQSAAWTWLSWATSKQYDSLVASKYGWSAVPPGSRTSLYSNASYLKAAAPFANITLQSIDGTDPDHPTLTPVPYVGVQYVDIPQFETLGMTVGQQIAGAIAGTESVSQAISAAQSAASAYTPQELSGTN